jgi:cell wall-associated NlpC family hydrolase
MRNALKNLAIVIALISTLNVTALAVPTNGTLQPNSDSITKIQSEREGIEIKIEQFDDEIEKNIARTEECKLKISQTEKDIKIAVEAVNDVEIKAAKEEELFSNRMRILYMNGFDGYTDILLSAESIGDFISRIESVKTVINYDKKVMDEFKTIKNQLNENKQKLSDRIELLLSLQAENKQKLNEIILTKETQRKLIVELNRKEVVLLASLNGSEGAVNTSGAKSVPKTTPSRGSINMSQSDVLAYASEFIGIPYRWGGTSPSTGFDCSGFTQYVYGHFGISIGRTTGSQIGNGVQVSRSNLKPGDLVFFGNNNNPHHTGIYVGNNSYIHSPRTGDVIKISAMTRSDFITGRRVR